MKKIFIALAFIANIALFSACSKDRCPAHGEVVPAVEVEQNIA